MVTKRTPTVDGGGKLLEKFIPTRLGDASLSATIDTKVSTGVAPKLDKTEAATTYVPAAKNTVIIFGDSLTAQNGTGSATLNPTTPQDAQDARGYWNWANAYMGRKATLVRNAGVGGDTTAQMRARMNADVLAYDSDWVVFCGGSNDVANDRTLAAIQADVTAILDALRADGRKVLIMTAAPSASYNTTGRRDVLGKLNRWLMDLPSTRAGVHAADIWRVVADPATGSPATGMATDVIHWSHAGALRVGKVVADVLGPLLAAKPNRTIGLLDPENIHGNPQFGTGTGWAALGAGVTATYTALPDRWATEANLAIAGVADSAERGIQYIEPVANGRYAAGDIVQASARFRWSGATPVSLASNFYQPFVRIMARLADGSFNGAVQSMAVASSNTVPNVGIPADGEIVAITARLTLPANVANLYMAVGWQGMASGTVKVSDVAFWKNA